MKRLLDDTVSTRPLASLFFLLGGSGQIHGHHLSRDRASKTVNHAYWLCAMWCGGLLVGWAIWGGK